MSKTKRRKKIISHMNNPFDFILFIAIIILLALGLIMVLSASSPTSLSQTGSSYSFFSKQIVYAIFGLVMMLIISKIDYRIYKKYKNISYFASVTLLILVLLIGYKANDAKRWIDLGFTNFQPSEAAKFLLIIFYAAHLSINKEQLRTFKGFFFNMVAVGIIMALLLLEPHMSAAMIILLTVVVMILTAGGNIAHFVMSGLAVRNTSYSWHDYNRAISFKKDNRIFRPMGRSPRFWLASNTIPICNWFRWAFWSRVAV